MTNLIIKYFFGLIIYYISYFIPRKETIWVFGAWKGLSYSDNSKYLFEYINEKQENVRAIWLVRDNNLKNELRDKGYEVYNINSISALFYSLKAKYGVVSNGVIDINRFAIKNMIIVNLWHGIPLKPILYSDKKTKTINDYKIKKKISNIFPFLKSEIDYSNTIVPSSSAYVSMIFSKVFKKNDFPILGFPRNDGIFRPQKTPLREELQKTKDNDYSIGIYMPTYRQKHEFKIMSYFLENSATLNEFLFSKKFFLYMKLHPFEKSIDLPASCTNIKVIPSDSKDDIYNLLSSFDFLITDYSSILFDYAALKRPIILSPFDYKSYLESNGNFILDYYKELPYPHANSWNEIIKLLRELKSNSFVVDNVQTEYSRKIHQYIDGNNSKRVYYYILQQSLLNKTKEQ